MTNVYVFKKDVLQYKFGNSFLHVSLFGMALRCHKALVCSLRVSKGVGLAVNAEKTTLSKRSYLAIRKQDNITT